MLKDYIFTSESDSVLDAMLEQDPRSRVACETMITTGLVVLAGEVTTKAEVDFQKVVRERIREIGYDDSAKGFDCDTCSVMVALDKQSPDIAQGVSEGEGLHTEQGAGDQGLMFGYAVNETDNFMPLTTDLSHKLARRLTDVRKNGIVPEFRADGKTQVSAEYKDGKLNRIDTIVVSTQHSENLTHEQVVEAIREEVVKPLPH
jgi:S-adenosylmethionine synthetase